MISRPPARVELLQGTLDVLILRTLLNEPKHGHAIAKHIQRTSEEVLQVETGSLYPALHRLEAKGWVAASWELSEKGKTRPVLSPHAARTQTTRHRTVELGDVLAGHELDPEPRGPGGPMISFFRKLGWLAHRRSKAEQLAAELQFHLEEETEEHQAAGMSVQEARGAARRELGNLGLVHEDTRAAWGWILLEQLAQDLRYGARTMLRNPAFTALASLSLALGIGANTAIYSFMDALLMRSLPVADPASLVALKWHITAKKGTENTVVHQGSGYFDDDPRLGFISPIFPYPAFEQLRKSSSALSVVVAYHPAGKLNFFARQQADIAGGEYVSGDYFRGLGIVPAAGRLIAGADDRAGVPAVLVLSYGFAQTRFGYAAGAVGQKVLIDNVPFTVSGVTPQGFFGVDPSKAPDLYLPLHADLLLDPERTPGAIDRYHDEHYYWIEMMGRLPPGVALAQAQAGLAADFDAWVAGTATTALERKNLPRFLLQDGATGVDRRRGDYSQMLGILSLSKISFSCLMRQRIR
jgi:macrolide transport system ATP-binding/permease protein